MVRLLNLTLTFFLFKDAQNAVLQQLAKQMEANPALKLAALDHHDGTTTFVATTETEQDFCRSNQPLG